MINASQIRKDIANYSGSDIPISGGGGNSRDNPIIINEPDPSKSAYYIQQVVWFINYMQGEDWEFVESNILNIDGNIIEQYKISRNSDIDNYYNYYFDISASYSS